jgi:hypothetical protein
MDCVDAFLNPFREGGATGGTYAAQQNKLILTLRDCHNGSLAGPDVAFETVEAFRKGVLRVASDKAYAQTLRDQLQAFVFDQSNAETVGQMLEKLTEIAAKSNNPKTVTSRPPVAALSKKTASSKASTPPVAPEETLLHV